jgi:hypothetical protein
LILFSIFLATSLGKVLGSCSILKVALNSLEGISRKVLHVLHDNLRFMPLKVVTKDQEYSVLFCEVI